MSRNSSTTGCPRPATMVSIWAASTLLVGISYGVGADGVFWLNSEYQESEEISWLSTSTKRERTAIALTVEQLEYQNSRFAPWRVVIENLVCRIGVKGDVSHDSFDKTASTDTKALESCKTNLAIPERQQTIVFDL